MQVFVIHGHDLEAVEEIQKFLGAFGLEHLSFQQMAVQLGAAARIDDILREGMKEAGAVLALFTPDERVALYEPKERNAAQVRAAECRWQARPNVLFEAGLAFGIARQKTILVSLGEVQMFTNVAGFMTVELHKPHGKQQLFGYLNELIQGLQPKLADWLTNPMAGDFFRWERKRWEHYDELDQLTLLMSNQAVGRERRSLLEVVRLAVLNTPGVNWGMRSSREFIDVINECFPGEQAGANAFWWLVVFGFLRYKNDRKFIGGPSYTDSVDLTMIAERGQAFVARVRALASN